MNAETASKILALNHQFYQSFAGEFSDTRGRLQPGVQELLKTFSPQASILDLGCGNGELARQLASLQFQGSYLGTDFSANLLARAAQDIPASLHARFLKLDLTQADWSASLPGETFDLVLCFAALHHIPALENRLAVCRQIRNLISPGGRLLLSNWQFLKSERFKKRILPWTEAGLSPEDVDPGDYLLDWRRGGRGIRYVHHFSGEELRQLAEGSRFTIAESFQSDGQEGNLSLYQVWLPV